MTEEYRGVYEERQRMKQLLFQHSGSLPDLSFCECQSNLENFDNNWIFKCHCGEGPSMPKTWVWEKDDENLESEVSLSEENTVIAFHNDFSHGTAICRGNTLFKEGIHFWEIKILSPVYGTDVMIGVANKNFSLSQYQTTFKSALGSNDISWGLSYRGNIYHDDQWLEYSPPFKRKTIVGCLLDLSQNTLSFYINRKPMGIAFRNVFVGEGLYPLVSSTAARIGVRLIRSQSTSLTLEYLACCKIRQLVKSNQSILDVLTFPPGLKSSLLSKMPWLVDATSNNEKINASTNPESSCSTPLSLLKRKAQSDSDDDNNENVQSKIRHNDTTNRNAE